MPKETKKKIEPEILAFLSANEWRNWLETNYSREEGIWLKMYKKASGIPTVFYPEALDTALCFGWIDGQVKSFDSESYIQKFTPRRKRSNWSKRNIDHVQRLTSGGLMRPPGLKEVEAAKADGRWEMAYDSPSQMTVPDEFLAMLTADDGAQAFFEGLNKVNKYSIGFRIQTAKTDEKRGKVMEEIFLMMKNGRKFHE
jgi:uncharacterized protein YdeI (YjbR/CyaY-like superfamily)